MSFIETKNISDFFSFLNTDVSRGHTNAAANTAAPNIHSGMRLPWPPAYPVIPEIRINSKAIGATKRRIK